MTATLQIPNGPGFSLRAGAEDFDITCPGGKVLTIGVETVEALSSCSGLAAEVECEPVHGGLCASDSECGNGWRCCPLGSMGDAEKICMEVTACPAGF